jgi:hypothetical protein
MADWAGFRLRWTGFRLIGLRWTGLHLIGLRWTGFHLIGLRWTGFGLTGRCWAGLLTQDCSKASEQKNRNQRSPHADGADGACGAREFPERVVAVTIGMQYLDFYMYKAGEQTNPKEHSSQAGAAVLAGDRGVP